VGERWESTTVDFGKIGTGRFINLFTGRSTHGGQMRLSEVFDELPFAALVLDKT